MYRLISSFCRELGGEALLESPAMSLICESNDVYILNFLFFLFQKKIPHTHNLDDFHLYPKGKVSV